MAENQPKKNGKEERKKEENERGERERREKEKKESQGMPLNTTKYREKEYWNQRYLHEETFEWFESYSCFRDELRKHILPSDRILILGCGNSKMSAEMYHDGFQNIINIDYSPVVIEKMAEKYKNECPKMQWVVDDITELATTADQSIDVVLEKGTIDALMAGERDVWHPEPQTRLCVDQSMRQISRVLKPDSGRFISITFTQPHFRRPFFLKEEYRWALSVAELGVGFHFFVILLQKAPATVSDGGLCIRLTDSESDSDPRSSLSEDDEDFLLKQGMEEEE